MELYWKWKEIGDKWMLTKEQIKYLNDATVLNEVASTEEEAILMFFELPSEMKVSQFMSSTEIINWIETRTKLKLSPTKLGQSLKKLGFVKMSKRRDDMKIPMKLYEVAIKVTTLENPNF